MHIVGARSAINICLAREHTAKMEIDHREEK